MPKLTCPCGHVHDLSPIPDDGWLTVRSREYDDLMDAERADNREARSSRVGLWGLLYECPACGRLMWQQPGGDRFAVYRPDP